MPLPCCLWYSVLMEKKEKYPKRKRNRLPRFDYSTPGAYFITICAHEHKCVFSRVQVSEPVGDGLARPVVILTNLGHIVEQQIAAIPNRFPTVSVDAYVIMPNHIHLLLSLHQDAGRASPSPTVGNIVGTLKSLCVRAAKPYLNDKPLFQRSYYDHVIRDERDYRETWAYMDGNPGRWAEDELYTQ